MRSSRRAVVFAGLLLFATTTLRSQESPLGVAPSSRAALARAEAVALAVPSPASARALLRALTEEPHVAGTPADYKTALFVRDKLRAWGWQADLKEYQVLLNYPVKDSVSLAIVRPERRDLPTIETPHPADKDSASPDAFPGFHGYGVSGDATGQVVYANYGRPEDFEALDRLGVEVAGKVVLVRYGELFRGLKVLNAQKRGAVGILMMSDPAEDGYARGDVYPNGPFRPGSALQRGSVQFLSLGPGDPTTPGVPSLMGAKRIPFNPLNGFPLDGIRMGMGTYGIDAPNGEFATDTLVAWEAKTGLKRADFFATIPSLPISYDSARPILEGMGGPNVPAGWQGGLPLPYHCGPGPVEVRLAITMDYKIRPIWNVIATIRGEAEPDRWVMIGNHRDAWVYGAVDPGSGSAATMEACRAIGEAVKAGWKPRRTLLYASWDAEEYGLVGSTEWAEEYAREIDTKALMMINVDVAVGGVDLDVSGVPSLRDAFLEAADDITDPRTGKSLGAGWRAARRARWAAQGAVDLDPGVWEGGEPRSARAEFVPQLDSLGSGSDYTAVLDHLGVPCLDTGFKGRYGVYHAIQDNFFWMEKFGDPEFLTHTTAARFYALLAIRAAGSEVAPFRFAPYGEALRDYADDLRRILVRKARMADPTRPGLPAEALDGLIPPIREFREAARLADESTATLASRDGISGPALARTNEAIQRVERAFLLPEGLPGRPWFRHAVYAPGLTTGYASWPLPGVRQAVLAEDRTMFAAQLPALIDRLKAATAALRAVARTAGEAAGAPNAPAGGGPRR